MPLARLRAAPCQRVIFATSSAADLAGNSCLLQRPVRGAVLAGMVMPPAGSWSVPVSPVAV
jgi:hypothetical protein